MFEKVNLHEGEFYTLEGAYDNTYDRSLPQLMASGDLTLCNCAECGTTLISQTYAIQRAVELKLGIITASFPKIVMGRVKGRPYCDRCLS